MFEFSVASEPSKPIEYEGAAAGKYQWHDSRPKGDADSRPSPIMFSAAAEPSKPIEYEGAAAGKYQWDDSRPKGDADSALGQAITKYGWSDGKKQVSVYIELVPGGVLKL